MKQCTNCLAFKPLSEYYLSSYKANQPIARCKVCIAEIRKAARVKHSKKGEYRSKNKEKNYSATKEWHLANKEKVKAHQHKNVRTLNSRFRKAKREATKRNKDWFLSKEEYEVLIEDACFYCDGFFPKTEVGSGLDRVDNAKGYYLSNVVSCCFTCNKVKSDVLSALETREVIKLVIAMRQPQLSNITQPIQSELDLDKSLGDLVGGDSIL
jgi:hypothetical protein